jgi:predicted peroxiredoxin
MTVSIRRTVLTVISLFVLLSGPLSAAGQGSLFINLTSNEINRAAMAVNFGHRVLLKKKIPATIFLNVDGVRLLNKNIPQHQHAKGKTIHQMLQAFMKDGGKVIVCPMCMKHVGGMSKDDLIDGVLIGGPDTTWAALFADNVTVLSY